MSRSNDMKRALSIIWSDSELEQREERELQELQNEGKEHAGEDSTEQSTETETTTSAEDVAQHSSDETFLTCEETETSTLYQLECGDYQKTSSESTSDEDPQLMFLFRRREYFCDRGDFAEDFRPIKGELKIPEECKGNSSSCETPWCEIALNNVKEQPGLKISLNLLNTTMAISIGTQYEYYPDQRHSPYAFNPIVGCSRAEYGNRLPKFEVYEELQMSIYRLNQENNKLKQEIQKKEDSILRAQLKKSENMVRFENQLEALRCRNVVPTKNVHESFRLITEKLQQTEKRLHQLKEECKKTREALKIQTKNIRDVLREKNSHLVGFQELKDAYKTLNQELKGQKPYTYDLMMIAETLLKERETSHKLFEHHAALLTSAELKFKSLKRQRVRGRQNYKLLKTIVHGQNENLDLATNVMIGMKTNETLFLKHINDLQEQLDLRNIKYEDIRKKTLSIVHEVKEEPVKLQEKIESSKEGSHVKTSSKPQKKKKTVKKFDI